MLEWIRGARIDYRTGVAIIVIAIAIWALVVWGNLRDFVPDELTQPTEVQS